MFVSKEKREIVLLVRIRPNSPEFFAIPKVYSDRQIFELVLPGIRMCDLYLGFLRSRERKVRKKENNGP